ncbi:hypothetical protein LINPERPRIM_LOCUS9791 [Linum perenne]
MSCLIIVAAALRLTRTVKFSQELEYSAALTSGYTLMSIALPELQLAPLTLLLSELNLGWMSKVSSSSNTLGQLPEVMVQRASNSGPDEGVVIGVPHSSKHHCEASSGASWFPFEVDFLDKIPRDHCFLFCLG